MSALPNGREADVHIDALIPRELAHWLESVTRESGVTADELVRRSVELLRRNLTRKTEVHRYG